MCPLCTENPVSINYHRKGVTYYRQMCAACSRKGRKVKAVPPEWYKKGYRKKPVCDRCGFKAEHVNEQMRVVYVDGNIKNTDWLNLKTVCLNCIAGIAKSKMPWKPDITKGF